MFHDVCQNRKTSYQYPFKDGPTNLIYRLQTIENKMVPENKFWGSRHSENYCLKCPPPYALKTICAGLSYSPQGALKESNFFFNSCLLIGLEM
jgi:hypothetical protein